MGNNTSHALSAAAVEQESRAGATLSNALDIANDFVHLSSGEGSTEEDEHGYGGAGEEEEEEEDDEEADGGATGASGGASPHGPRLYRRRSARQPPRLGEVSVKTWAIVASYLSPRDLVALQGTCRGLYARVSHNAVWADVGSHLSVLLLPAPTSAAFARAAADRGPLWQRMLRACRWGWVSRLCRGLHPLQVPGFGNPLTSSIASTALLVDTDAPSLPEVALWWDTEARTMYLQGVEPPNRADLATIGMTRIKFPGVPASVASGAVPGSTLVECAPRVVCAESSFTIHARGQDGVPEVHWYRLAAVAVGQRSTESAELSLDEEGEGEGYEGVGGGGGAAAWADTNDDDASQATTPAVDGGWMLTWNLSAISLADILEAKRERMALEFEAESMTALREQLLAAEAARERSRGGTGGVEGVTISGHAGAVAHACGARDGAVAQPGEANVTAPDTATDCDEGSRGKGKGDAISATSSGECSSEEGTRGPQPDDTDDAIDLDGPPPLTTLGQWLRHAGTAGLRLRHMYAQAEQWSQWAWKPIQLVALGMVDDVLCLKVRAVATEREKSGSSRLEAAQGARVEGRTRTPFMLLVWLRPETRTLVGCWRIPDTMRGWSSWGGRTYVMTCVSARTYTNREMERLRAQHARAGSVPPASARRAGDAAEEEADAAFLCLHVVTPDGHVVHTYRSPEAKSVYPKAQLIRAHDNGILVRLYQKQAPRCLLYYALDDSYDRLRHVWTLDGDVHSTTMDFTHVVAVTPSTLRVIQRKSGRLCYSQKLPKNTRAVFGRNYVLLRGPLPMLGSRKWHVLKLQAGRRRVPQHE